MPSTDLTCAGCGATGTSESGTCACGGMLVTPPHRAEIVQLEGVASEHEQLRRKGFSVLAVAITAHVVQRFVGSPGLSDVLEAVVMLGIVIGAPVAALASLRQAKVRRQLERARAPRELPAARIV